MKILHFVFFFSCNYFNPTVLLQWNKTASTMTEMMETLSIDTLDGSGKEGGAWESNK